MVGKSETILPNDDPISASKRKKNGDIGNFDPGDSIADTTNQLSF